LVASVTLRYSYSPLAKAQTLSCGHYRRSNFLRSSLVLFISFLYLCFFIFSFRCRLTLIKSIPPLRRRRTCFWNVVKGFFCSEGSATSVVHSLIAADISCAVNASDCGADGSEEAAMRAALSPPPKVAMHCSSWLRQKRLRMPPCCTVAATHLCERAAGGGARRMTITAHLQQSARKDQVMCQVTYRPHDDAWSVKRGGHYS
jgi:hypothetical protein